MPRGLNGSESANLHSLFATLAGIGIVGSMIGSAIVEDDLNKRIVNISGVIFVTLTSALFGINSENQGIWQRAMWIGGLSCLTYTFHF